MSKESTVYRVMLPSSQLIPQSIRSSPRNVHGPTACTLKSKNPKIHITNMAAIDEALEALQSQKFPNYAKTVKDFGVDRTTL